MGHASTYSTDAAPRTQNPISELAHWVAQTEHRGGGSVRRRFCARRPRRVRTCSKEAPMNPEKPDAETSIKNGFAVGRTHLRALVR